MIHTSNRGIKAIRRLLHAILTLGIIAYWIFCATYMIIAISDFQPTEYDWIVSLSGGNATSSKPWSKARVYTLCSFFILVSITFAVLSFYPIVAEFYKGIKELAHLWDCVTAFLAVLHMIFAFVFAGLNHVRMVGGCVGVASLFAFTGVLNFHRQDQLLVKQALRRKTVQKVLKGGEYHDNQNKDDLIVGVEMQNTSTFSSGGAT